MLAKPTLFDRLRLLRRFDKNQTIGFRSSESILLDAAKELGLVQFDCYLYPADEVLYTLTERGLSALSLPVEIAPINCALHLIIHPNQAQQWLFLEGEQRLTLIQEIRAQVGMTARAINYMQTLIRHNLCVSLEFHGLTVAESQAMIAGVGLMNLRSTAYVELKGVT